MVDVTRACVAADQMLQSGPGRTCCIPGVVPIHALLSVHFAISLHLAQCE